MFEFFRENPVGTLFAFCMLLLATYHIIKLFIDRQKSIVECECEREQCDCGCHEDEDEEENKINAK